MYPPSTQVDVPGNPPSHETATSQSTDQTHGYYYPRPSIAPPRPLEPRPMLLQTHSEGSTAQVRSNAFQGPSSGHQDYRTHTHSQGHTLPGLRDILTARPSTGTQPSYNTQWGATSGSTTQHNNTTSPSLNGWHPPLVLPWPGDTIRRYPNQHANSYELPVLDTQPVSRNPPSLPVSPYAGYPDAERDNRVETHSRTPTASYSANGAPSPFSPGGPDLPQQSRRTSRPERASNVVYLQAGAENHGPVRGVVENEEGRFYLYDDGFRIPTQVDGEDVNPAWGLTKANKPRKRLALACLDCREKKIKCEPGKSGCIQCEKQMRPCRRAPEKPAQDNIASATSYPPTSDLPSPSYTNDMDSLNKRRTRADPSPPNAPNKRLHHSPPPQRNTELSAVHVRESAAQKAIDTPTEPPVAPVDGIRADMSWEEDPYLLEPEFTTRLLEIYFTHVNSATYCLFPPGHFFRYLKAYDSKCQNERMVLYAMLAVASIFAGEGLNVYGDRCAWIAGDAVGKMIGKSNVCMAQCRILLSVYHWSKGSVGLALDYAGAAIRTNTCLGLNTEDGCLDDEVSMKQARFEFDFSRPQLAECKRRTFWASFFQDRVGGTSTCAIKAQDVFTRLPCSNDMYERSIASDAPLFSYDIFDPTISTLTSHANSMAPAGWLMLTATTWGDVVDFVFRASYQTEDAYRRAYQRFYSETEMRLDGWIRQLPEHLQYNIENLTRSFQHGYAGTFITMHILYHLSMMKLNRCVRHALLPTLVPRNIRRAHVHAHQILQIMIAVRAATDMVAEFEFTTPFPGYATLAAIDIVGAGCLEPNIRRTRDDIEHVLGTLRTLAQYWSSAKDQLKACETRLYQLKNTISHPNSAMGGCWLSNKWGLAKPLEQEFGPENDCIFGLCEKRNGEAVSGEDVYWKAFKESELTEEEACILGLRSR